MFLGIQDPNNPFLYHEIKGFAFMEKHHNPIPHWHVIESCVGVNAPAIDPEQVKALKRFDNSLWINRTAETIHVKCHTVQANTVALNLAFDILNGKSVTRARNEHFEIITKLSNGKDSSFANPTSMCASTGSIQPEKEGVIDFGR